MTLPSWSNNGPFRYDYAITGLVPDSETSELVKTAIPFFGMNSTEYPYLRQSFDNRREQIDLTAEPGEQSLQGWWYRSQSSFDYGAGLTFFDTARNERNSRRFADSCGVNVFEEGEVTLLRKSTRIDLTGDSSLDTGAHKMFGFANGGQEGVLVATGNILRKVLANGTVSTITWGGSGTIIDITTDGGAYYVLDATGVYRGLLPSGTGTKIYSFDTGVTVTTGIIRYAKSRLFITANQYAWAGSTIPPTIPTTLKFLPTDQVTATGNLGYFFASPSADWVWTDVAEGPSAVYGSGYSGDLSYIYAVTIEVDNKLVPTFSAPFVVAEFPRGELALSILGYLGTYIVIGTNLGVRVGIISGDGSLVIGPQIFESNANVSSLLARGNFIYAAGSRHTDAAGVNRIGIYKIDLSQPINPESPLTFAYARDLYLDGSTWNENHIVDGIAPIGYTDRIAFSINEVGLAFEATGERVDEGWIETGKIRYDTAEDKIFQYIRVNNLSVDGAIKVSWRDEAAVLTDIATYETDTIRTYDTEASDSEPHPWVSYRFTLIRGNASNTNSPILLSYQLKSQPANIKQRAIRVALMCYEREQATDQRIAERSPWERVQAIEAVEQAGAVVRFQDLNTGEQRLCIIEQVQFVSENIGYSRGAKANPGGVLVVTLRTVL
jgi:hypothetical protein